MFIEPAISGRNQPPIEAIGCNTRFARSDQHDCLAARVEGIGDTSFPIADTEAELLHILVSRAFQGVRMRPTKGRSQSLKNYELSGRRRPNIVPPFYELCGERVMEGDRPSHETI